MTRQRSNCPLRSSLHCSSLVKSNLQNQLPQIMVVVSSPLAKKFPTSFLTRDLPSRRTARTDTIQRLRWSHQRLPSRRRRKFRLRREQTLPILEMLEAVCPVRLTPQADRHQMFRHRLGLPFVALLRESLLNELAIRVSCAFR